MKIHAAYRLRKRHLFIIFTVLSIILFVLRAIPPEEYDLYPGKMKNRRTYAGYTVPLDPESPWPKFRNNALQNGRTRTLHRGDKILKPWRYMTGKGIFSSPVIDGDGTVYIGSGDHTFYAIDQKGRLKWKFRTGAMIDSTALLDDRKRVYFGSGDTSLYCLNRGDGIMVWSFKADTVDAVEKRYDIRSYNLNWFQAGIAMLRDGTIIVPNDNFLIYRVDRDTGKKKEEYPGNEMIWSLPAVNTKTGRIFFGSQYLALKNTYCVNTKTGETEWTNGGLGSNAASPLLTSDSGKGAVILGGFDGYLRAYSQESGRQLWKRGLRGHIYSSPAQLSDGTIIQPSADGTVYALEPDTGKIKWAFDTLEPIRSSPAVDSRDRIYTGSGEGRLFCINPDGTLRWRYLLIEGKRNDLNSSPGLGKSGIYIAGENGGIFFVPYDYPLTERGMKERKGTSCPGEPLPPEGAFLIYTEPFGGLLTGEPRILNGNQPLTFTLFVRKNNDTIKTHIDPDTLKVSVSGNPPFTVHVSANRQFMILTPREFWSREPGKRVDFTIEGNYTVDLCRMGLLFFWGSRGGRFRKKISFTLRPGNGSSMPYDIPRHPGERSTVFRFSRFAAPNPTMLPSWNQIGFDSLNYLAGMVEGDGKKVLVWVVGGKLKNGKTEINPRSEARFPLTLEYREGYLTFYNYDGFKVNFIGTWDMPFGRYRISARAADTRGNRILSPTLTAIALGDEIKYYGKFLKLMGMTEISTGHMAVFGGLDISVHHSGPGFDPGKMGEIRFKINRRSAWALIKGSRLRVKDHVFSLLLVNRDTGRAVPLYYTGRTKVVAGPEGAVKKVYINYAGDEVEGEVTAYLMVDTYPAASATVIL